MKKLLMTLVLSVGLIGLSQAALIDDAVTWMYSNGLTIFNNTRDYKPNNSIRRDEAAKLFVMFAELMDKADYVTPVNQCIFDDLYEGHADLVNIMVQACRYGIFLGHNNKFMPTGTLTNEQAVTVLVRILYGKQSESGVKNWSDNYYTKANEHNLLKNVSVTNRGQVATRGNVGIMIYSVKGMFVENEYTQFTTSWYNDVLGFSIQDPHLYGIGANITNEQNLGPNTTITKIDTITSMGETYRPLTAHEYFVQIIKSQVNQNILSCAQSFYQDGFNGLNSTYNIDGITIYRGTPPQEGESMLSDMLCFVVGNTQVIVSGGGESIPSILSSLKFE